MKTKYLRTILMMPRHRSES